MTVFQKNISPMKSLLPLVKVARFLLYTVWWLKGNWLFGCHLSGDISASLEWYLLPYFWSGYALSFSSFSHTLATTAGIKKESACYKIWSLLCDENLNCHCNRGRERYATTRQIDESFQPHYWPTMKSQRNQVRCLHVHDERAASQGGRAISSNVAAQRRTWRLIEYLSFMEVNWQPN